MDPILAGPCHQIADLARAALDQIESAKRVCNACDASTACLEFALATNQESGVWGGTTEEERRKLRKQWLAARRRNLNN